MDITKVLLVALLFVASSMAVADMEYEVGVYTTFYEGNDIGAKIRVGNTKWPVYGWISSETADMRILGQDLSDADILSVGFGVEHHWEEFSVFFDAGYAFFDTVDKDFVRDEIVYTELINNHNTSSGTRPIPSGDPNKQDGHMSGGPNGDKYDAANAYTDYEVRDSFIGRIGVGYQVSKHIKVTASYRFLTPSEHMNLWDQEQRFEKGLGWWQETRQKDMNAFEMGIYATF